MFGSGLHIKVDDEARAIQESSPRLARAGIKIGALEPIPPSMEDVFVGLIEEQEQGNGGQMNFRRTSAMARKELLHIIRDPRSLMAALTQPVMVLLLFGYALSLDVDRIPTMIYDADHSAVEPESGSGIPRLAIFSDCR